MPLPHKVIICGVARDIEKRVPHSLRIMEKIGGLFERSSFIVYENNSMDRTRAVLEEWERSNQGARVISEWLSDVDMESMFHWENGRPYKPDELARARNIVLERAMERDVDFILWMDMDFVLEPDYPAILGCFARTDWDAVFANGRDPAGRFWDWFAFRDANFPEGPETIGRKWWAQKFHVELETEWYPVLSAFGGFGIYRKDILRGCAYSAPPGACEHTKLHEMMAAKGARMFINPAMIFRYGGNPD